MPTDTDKYWNRANTIINGIIALITAGIFLVAYFGFKGAEKQFDSGNTPYLRIAKIRFYNFKIDSTPDFTFNIENLGNQPVKILTCVLGLRPDTATPDPFTSFNDSLQRMDIVNYYISKDNPYLMGIHADTVTEGLYYGMKNHTAFLYMYGIIRYINLTTNQRRIYKFSTAMYPAVQNADSATNPYASHRMIINDNKNDP